MRFFATKPGAERPGSLSALVETVNRFDRGADRAFDHLRGKPAFDAIFYAASAAGEFGLLWQGLAVARLARGDRHGALRASGGLLVESLLVNGVIKSAFKRSRPQEPNSRPLPLRKPLTSSFPSGHASAAAFAVVVLGEGDPLLPLYGALAVVVATSRVFVRIHHASDVAAGAVVGACLGLLVRRLVPLRAE